MAPISDAKLIATALIAAKQGRSSSFSYGDTEYFQKVCARGLVERELKGHQLCSEYYPVPQLLGSFSEADSVHLLYEYEKSIVEDRGLLVDIFSGAEKVSFRNVLDMFANGFKISLRRDIGSASDIFFKDRVSTRLLQHYDEKFCDTEFSFRLNGQLLSVRMGPVVDQISSFFSTERVSWCVAGQCDPNDLNIGTKPILFDFTGGGYVPVWAEFATLFWYQLAQGSYLAPRYNKQAFARHEAILNRLDKVKHDSHQIEHHPQKLRKAFLSDYIETVLEPLWEQIGSDDSWYVQFKNHVAMKILCVFDLTTMSLEDMLLSLGYLELIYNREAPKHPRDLLSLFP